MTEEEYLKEKKKRWSDIDKGLIRYFKKEITVEQMQEIRSKWRDLINNARKEKWWKHL